MTVSDPNQPDSHEIARRQNLDVNLRRAAAKDKFYSRAGSWHLIGTSVSMLLALASPVTLLLRPDLGPLLGAIAGLWLFVSRILLEPLANSQQRRGASVQEEFDCAVLGLTWNGSLVSRLSEEEMNSASRRAVARGRLGRFKDWYPMDSAHAWPKSVEVCQRSNAVWARRQHWAYGAFLYVVVGVWAVSGVVLAVAQDASLAAYLTTVALPSLPALLDGVELGRRHQRSAARRAEVERSVDELLASSTPATSQQLREIQDQIFELRRDTPNVAGWFYYVLRGRYEDDMRYAAAQRAEGDYPLAGGIDSERRVQPGRLPHRKGAPGSGSIGPSARPIFPGQSTFPHDQHSADQNYDESGRLGRT